MGGKNSGRVQVRQLGFVSSGHPVLQICSYKNNVSQAEVTLGGESQIKVRKADFAVLEKSWE